MQDSGFIKTKSYGTAFRLTFPLSMQYLLFFSTSMLCNDVRHQHRFEYAHRRRRGSRNLLHSGNFRERAIGNLDNFSDFTVLI